MGCWQNSALLACQEDGWASKGCNLDVGQSKSLSAELIVQTVGATHLRRDGYQLVSNRKKRDRVDDVRVDDLESPGREGVGLLRSRDLDGPVRRDVASAKFVQVLVDLEGDRLGNDEGVAVSLDSGVDSKVELGTRRDVSAA